MEETGTVIVLTPMNLEYRAVRAQLTGLRRQWHPDGTFFEVGRVPGVAWPVALMVTGEGNLNAAVLADRAIARFQARALFVVGVAGSLQDDIELGDVVVATWVYGYHGGKEGPEGFQARPRSWPATHRLEQAARAADIAGSWTGLLPEAASPAVHFKPVAAGEVVLNSRDSPLALQLKRNYNDAAAIEMESAGAAAAAHLNTSVPVLTIRGISDKADGRTHPSDAAGLQAVAADHAAAFMAGLLKVLAPEGQETADFLDGRPADLPTIWHARLGVPRVAAAAILELHLVPALRTPPPARLLAAVTDDLIALGREENMFGTAAELSVRDPATVVAPASGLAVTQDGQRSAWMPLPSDTVGAVLDPADVTGRLTAMLSVLLRMDVPDPEEAGLAVGVAPSILLSEGRVADIPRKVTRQRTSLTPVCVPASGVLPLARIAASPDRIAAELCARLLLKFRQQTAPSARQAPAPDLRGTRG